MMASPDKKIYFLSDFHLGAPDHNSSLVREKKVVAFLEHIRHSASAIFIVGDIFDFWYEYKKVVPKGYTRLLGKLAEITDSGVPVYVFVGNHDMWMSGYFEQELNIPVYHQPQTFEWNGKKFLIGHGDGLGPGDHGYKFIKKIFRNPLCQWLFGQLHPTWGIGLANYFSRKSREKTGSSDEVFLGEENEWLVIYCKEVLQQVQYDYFVFGHRHLPLNIALPRNSRYVNLGDWIRNFTYASFDGTDVQLHKWEG
ncbi:MAG: UDP-2,3-diacylglucosamine diphosphatase [Chitinophagaceae bacterium]|nr:UDP-2,3-diacylglucosamine diphosphatase [Chitinophagaceae bacterium]MEA3425338.1 UDP-2,3-diacylglucosamine diphosphatase [Bacteroidota bacterium]MCA6453723.1 UDP-2,3-diacylglucosamine diphosphatase [Chitinophagaceae bacterium]MCA6455040.1 UDP-2,3-diacylglucosamine diphosphatase [Chitinophagaceae bacterium]MCA6458880.1 UDP-2,3-diacylglucosamine diphosphatase [Chitinophagaceae bacterium]